MLKQIWLKRLIVKGFAVWAERMLERYIQKHQLLGHQIQSLVDKRQIMRSRISGSITLMTRTTRTDLLRMLGEVVRILFLRLGGFW